MTKRSWTAHQLGRMSYGPTHLLQGRLVEARSAGQIGDTVLVVEHPPVITLGRGTKDGNLRVDRATLAARGIEVHEVGRGGDVTYHGPGQVVVYPIIDLDPDHKDVRRYVASLEEAMIRCVAGFGVAAARIDGLNGAWVPAATERELDRKIGAVGVRISRWVTMHGLALNVSTHLEDFDWIVPCGISDKAVTSIEAETGVTPALGTVAESLVEHFAKLYDATVRWKSGPPMFDTKGTS